MALGRDPYLNNLWLDREREEKGEELPESRAIGTFLDIRIKAENHEDLEKRLLDLEKSAIYYAKTVERLKSARFEGWEKEDIQSADERRRSAHNAFIDSVNILSRNFAEKGIDNSWRRMVGFSREEIGLWAFEIADFLGDEKISNNRR